MFFNGGRFCTFLCRNVGESIHQSTLFSLLLLFKIYLFDWYLPLYGLFILHLVCLDKYLSHIGKIFLRVIYMPNFPISSVKKDLQIFTHGQCHVEVGQCQLLAISSCQLLTILWKTAWEYGKCHSSCHYLSPLWNLMCPSWQVPIPQLASAICKVSPGINLRALKNFYNEHVFFIRPNVT